MVKWVYTFGGGTAEGGIALKELLGSKGAGLAETWPDVAALAAYALIVLVASTALYARRSRR